MQLHENHFARIWWLNGDQTKGTNGYFYTLDKEFAGRPDTVAHTWEPFAFNNFDKGYKTTDVRLAVIRRRSQPYTDSEVNGKRTRIWHPRGARVNGFVRYFTELLCFLDGYQGLITLNLKGLTGSVFTHRNDGLLIQHSKNVRSQDDRNVPSWAYWMHLRAPIDEQGNIKYHVTQNGTLATPPQLVPQGIATQEQLADLWVGDDLVNLGYKAFDATYDWQEYQRVNREEGEVW